MNFFRGKKIFAFGFSLAGFLVLFNLTINLSLGQTAYYTATEAAPSSSNVGGTVGSEASCNPAKNATALKNKANGLVAASGFAKAFGITDPGLEADSNQANSDVSRNDELVKSKDKFSDGDIDDATDLAKKACEENLKSSKKYKDEKKKAEKKCFEGKAGQTAKADAEKAAREKVGSASCAEGEEEEVTCSVEAIPNFGSTSGDCKKKGDNVRCSVSNFSCGVSCTKTCVPKKGSVQKSSSNRFAPVQKFPIKQHSVTNAVKASARITTPSGRVFVSTLPPGEYSSFSGPFVVDVVQETVTVETSPMTGLRVVDRTPPTVPVTTAPLSGGERVGGQAIESGSKSTDSRGGSIQSGAGRPLFSPFGGARF